MRLSAKCALAANADITREDEQRLDLKAGPVKPDVYQTIIASDLPPQEKEAGRIAQEVFTLIFAGSSSTARVLTRTTFHLASDPAIQNRLRQELKTIMADPSASPEMEQLEALPYLVSSSTFRSVSALSRTKWSYFMHGLETGERLRILNTTANRQILSTDRNHQRKPSFDLSSIVAQPLDIAGQATPLWHMDHSRQSECLRS